MSASGEIVSKERNHTEYLFSEKGWIQFDVNQLYLLTVDVIRRLVLALPEGAAVAALSMASASGNTVLADAKGHPVHPAISWMDTRVTQEIELVFGKLQAEEVQELLGWPLLNTFPLAHLSWLKYHRPELLQSAARVCMSTDYINFRLTGNWGIDHSTATTFYLQDQKTGIWHLPYIQQLGISKEQLPPLYSTGTILGRITADAASATRLSPGTPVVLGAFDHPCAARGAGVLDEGQFLLSTGTSWVGFFPVKDRQKAVTQKLLVDPFLHPKGAWGAMFSLSAIANSVDKFINKYISSAPDKYKIFDQLSGYAKPGGGGLLINPMLDHDVVIEDSYTKADIARAVMEGTAYLLKTQIDKLANAGMNFSSVMMVGGPSEALSWPQIIADVLNIEVCTINGSCAGATGAAILAGIGVGLYRDEMDAFRKLGTPKVSYKPNHPAHTAYRGYYKKFMDNRTMNNSGGVPS
ncbi:xylulokinase [Paenibacillus sp. J2TS4]|nr:xylulokinase [Paenibacillus sp. J2TS4]